MTVLVDEAISLYLSYLLVLLVSNQYRSISEAENKYDTSQTNPEETSSNPEKFINNNGFPGY